MKKKDLMKVWPLMLNGKFGKLSASAKGKFIKMIAALSSVVKAYESYRDTVSQKLMSEHEGFTEKLQKAQSYEVYMRDKNSQKPEMTEEEYKEFMKVYVEYVKQMNTILEEENDKDVKVKYEKLNAPEFFNFCESNDFTGQQALDLSVVMSSFS